MSGLQLNIPQADYKAFPERGTARNTEQMPLLIAESRTPLSAAGLMKIRLEVLEQLKNAPEDVRNAYEAVMLSWWDNYFDTGDGSLRHSDGRLKVVPDAQYLRSLGPDTELVLGAVPLSDDVYKGLEGEEFSAKQVEDYFNKSLSRREAKEHPGWLALARGDRALLGEFVDVTFAQAKERFNYDGKMMVGVYRRAAPEEGAAGRLWFVSGLGVDIFGGSGAVGYDRLDNFFGRLVGVAPEAQRVDGEQLVRPTLEQVVNLVLSAGQRYVPDATRAGFEKDMREDLETLYQ